MDLRDAPPAKDASDTFRPKPLPILVALVLAVGLSFLSFVTIEFLKLAIRLPERPQLPWISDSYYHLAELGYALLAISILRMRHPGTYGLVRPEGNSLVWIAVRWGALFGFLLAVMEVWPMLAGTRHPDESYPLTVLNFVGWVAFAGLFAGTAEEIFFRGLLVTYLAEHMPGRITFRGLSTGGAGVVVAGIYALSFSESLLNKPLFIAFGQLLYAFVTGIFFAHWYERSKSLVASIVGHNVSGAVAQALIFAMVARFR